MIDRRRFLRSALAAGLFPWARPRRPRSAQPAALERIGVQLFTLPRLLEKDFPATLELLAEIGYTELEFFGPYPFSVPAAHARWEAITPSLDFTQSGYFGRSVEEVRALMDRHGLSSPSMHIDLGTLTERLDETVEAAHTLGQRYAGISAIPADMRRTLDDYRRVADTFNDIGARMRPAGLRFLYHNHGYGLVEMEGEIPFRVLVERTDPDLVALEMDVYWTTAGGADPVAYLKDYPGRFRLMHIKDMAESVRFAGDGGEAAQWIELFPYMADAGSGVLDLPAILAEARRSGVEHFLLERDQAARPEEALRNSYRYLAALDFDD